METLSETAVADSCSRTDLIKIKIKHEWEITNFHLFPEKIGETLLSAIFFNDDDSKWCLKMYPYGRRESTKDYISLFLILISCKSEWLLADYKLSILTAEKKEIIIFEQKAQRIVIDKEDYGLDKFIKRIDLFEKVSELMPKMKFTILCEIQILSFYHSYHFRRFQFKIPESELSEHFNNIFENEKFSDIITVEVDDQKFQTHRDILAARSKVFADMINKEEMKKQKLKCIKIIGLTPKIVKEMLRYIYSEKVLNLDEIADDLLSAANQYDLERLKKLCENSLYDNLSVETAAKTLVLADFHKANELKAKTLRFIKNHAADVIKTEAWSDMVKNHNHLLELCYANVIE